MALSGLEDCEQRAAEAAQAKRAAMEDAEVLRERVKELEESLQKNNETIAALHVTIGTLRATPTGVSSPMVPAVLALATSMQICAVGRLRAHPLDLLKSFSGRFSNFALLLRDHQGALLLMQKNFVVLRREAYQRWARRCNRAFAALGAPFVIYAREQ